jgi:hypothetical protein
MSGTWKSFLRNVFTSIAVDLIRTRTRVTGIQVKGEYSVTTADKYVMEFELLAQQG